MSKTTKPSWQDNDALLTYRVGPVLCCGPTLPIITITPPPSLTHLPGTSTAEPGIFKHGSYIVSATDLRYRFGVKQENWKQPGQVIIAQHGDLTRGYYVDEIKDVIHFPDTGWGQLPAYLPRGIFTRTLLLEEQIYLYTEFDKLSQLQGSGYLAEYISQLEKIKQEETKQIEETKIQSKYIQPTEKNPSAAKASGKTGSVNPASNIQTIDSSITNKTPEPVNSLLPKSDTIENKATKTTATPESSSINRIKEKNQGDTVLKPEKNETEIISEARLKQETPNRINTGADNKTTVSKQNMSSNEGTATVSPGSITNKKESTQQTLKPVPSNAVNTIEQSPDNKITPEKIDHRPFVSNKKSEETPGSFVGLFIIFLILIMGAGGGYYYISHSVTVNNIASPSVHEAETVTSDQTTISNDSSLLMADAKESETYEISLKPPASSISEYKADDSNTSSPRSDINQVTTIEKSNREIKADEYHASIKQEQDTITIELDGPLPPAIKNIESSTAASDSLQELNTSPSEMNIITTDTLETESPELKSSKSKSILLKPEISKPESEKTTSTNPQKNKPVEIIHIIIKGDTLWAIAKHYLLNPFRYPELAKLSKIRNPDLIYPGNRVRIIYRNTSNK